MKNSIEKDIEIINNFIAYFNKNIQNGYKADLTVLGEEIEALEHILSDYKRVLKEVKRYKNMYEAEHQIHLVRNEQLDRKQKAIIKCNELENENKELKEENEKLKHKIDGQECVIEKQAHNEEVYEKLVMKLEKENKELKILKSGIQTLQNVGIEDGKYIVMSKTDFLNGSCKHLLDDYIPKQEIKDKIEELNRKIDKSIDNSKGGLDEEFIEKAGELLAQKRILQELLGSEE